MFLEFTALSLPAVIRIALPLAAFASAVYVTNRMTTESEMTVVQATGYSPFRLARPVLYFGLTVVLLMSLLMHFLVPLSSARLAERQADIAQNVTSRLLTEGQFIEPVTNVTFYVREITPAGELLNIFLADNRSETEQVTYTAAKAFLIRQDDVSQLVMLDGMVQTLSIADQKLFTTTFKDFAYNISILMGDTGVRGRRDSHLSTWELLNPTPALEAETGYRAAHLIARGHDRFSQSILGAVAALLGFATLMVGGYSRFGVWRQIVSAVFLIIVVKAIETVGLNVARSDPRFFLAAYLPSIVGFIMVWFLLFWASRPFLFRRRIKDTATI